MSTLLEDLGIVDSSGNEIVKPVSLNSEDSSFTLESEGINTSKSLLEDLGIVDSSGTEIVNDSEDYFKDVTYQSKFNEPVIAKPETKKSEPSNFWMGFDQTKTDVQNWALLLESKQPMSGWHNRYSKPLPEGAGKLDIFSPQELYGYDDPDMPKWEDMGSDARRIRLLELFNNNLDIKYPNRNDPDRETTKAEIGGSMLGALMTPSALAPIGKGWKAMMGLGAFFGFEWGVSEGLADEGKVNWKDTALYTSVGAFAVPLIIGTGRLAAKKFKKHRLATNEKLQLKSAQELLDTYETLMYDAVLAGEKASDISTKINFRLGINVSELRAAQKITGRTTTIPTKKDVDSYYEFKRYQLGKNPPKVGGWVQDFLGVISTEIKMMDEALFQRLRRLEFNTHAKLGENFESVRPFLKGLKKLKKGEQEKITLALYNGDIKTVQRILKDKPDMLEIFDDTRVVLNNLHKEAERAGLKLGYVENYFPRELLDGDKGYPALLKFMGRKKSSYLSEKLQAAKAKKGSALTDIESGNIVNKFLLDTYPIGTSTTKLKKGRTIDTLPTQLLKFYKTPTDSLHGYIRRVITETEKVRFFGAAWKGNGIASGTDLETSIGSIVRDLVEKGKITDGAQTEKLGEVLRARFITGEKAPGKNIQRFKSLTYAATLGNPVAAATQVGDVLFAAYKTGDLLGTINTMITKSMNPFTKNKITLREFGFVDIAEEFASTGGTAGWMRTAFKWSGFRGVDRIGKESLINRAFTNYTKAVKTKKGLLDFRKKWAGTFGDDMPALIKALKKGDMKNSDVKLLLWHDLSDMQPVSLSEMPLKYLQNPNGRLLYMLKTFTVKQFDVMRRDSYQLMKATKPKLDANQRVILVYPETNIPIRAGEKNGVPVLVPDFEKRRQGAKNLLLYATYYTAGGVSADKVKDWMMGREFDLKDSVVDKLWGLIGFNSYGADRVAKTGNVEEAVIGLVKVPTNMWGNLVSDALAATNVTDWWLDPDEDIEATGESIKALPYGNLAYNWFFGGREEAEERKEKKENAED